ncbi:MAG TPA: mechanosensitive ion channel family protein [Nitrospirota bacterium]|nr:mechanosensitive ion channel family protein [Nitrospirota bacterium]
MNSSKQRLLSIGYNEKITERISRSVRLLKIVQPFILVSSLCCILSYFLTLPFPTRTFAAPIPVSVAGPADKSTEPQTLSEDPLGRSTPYGTVIGFLTAAEQEDYQRASEYLESKMSGKKKGELARLLKIVLDRGLKISKDTVSRKPEGNLDDGLSSKLEKVGTAEYEGESLDILLHRIDQKAATPIWLFSSETLLGIPDAAEQLNPPLVERIFPKKFWGTRIAFLPLPHWIFILLILPLLLVFSWLLARVLIRIVRPLVLRRLNNLTESDAAWLTIPITLLIFALLLRILSPLSAYLYLRIFWFGAGTVLMIMALTWLLVRMVKLARRLQIARLRQIQLLNKIILTEIVTWFVQGVLIVAGLLLILKQLGFELTTAVAGLSIGGIAIAFAAQKTIENLFGTVMVITDQPIRVGDFCLAGNIEGTVESIGLRSTRIRTLNRTLVTIPNGQFSAMSIENLAHRDKFLFRHKFGLRYETTAEQLQHVLEEIRKMLSEYPGVEPKTHRTRFVRFGDFSLDIDVLAYVLTTDWEGFLAAQEDLLIRLMSIIETSGTSFAFPSQTMYITNDPVGTELKARNAASPLKADG